MTREEALRRIHRAAEEKLTELDLAGLELEEVPPEIGKCTQLKSLILSSIGLIEIPEVIGQLSNLTQLVLSDKRAGKFGCNGMRQKMILLKI